MSLLDTALPRFEDLFYEVNEATRTLEFHDRHRQHILAVSLLGSVLELAFGILTVLKKGNGTSAWVLMRSLLEAYVDLKNIVDDPKYDEFMHAAFLDQQRRRIGVVKGRGVTNPYLSGLAEDPAVAEQLQWVEAELQRLKQVGVNPLQVKERFERAGELDMYDGPYYLLSLQSHSNLGALEARHIDPSPQGFTVHYFREVTDDDTQKILDTSAGVLANSFAAVKSLLEGDPPSGLEGISEKLSAFREVLKEGA